MSEFLAYTLTGLFTGAAFAILASGLVLTYSTTRVFNIAHGALAMVFAFVFWDFSQKQGMPTWLALVLVLGVVAPAFGIFLQRVVVRDLGNAPVGVSLVVTVGLLVALIGLATQIWPSAARRFSPFFDGEAVTIFDYQMPWHQVVTIIVSVLVAVGLALLLTRTRIGTAMRASVDNPELLRLYGGRPDVAAALAWAIGTSLAALAGILLAAGGELQYYDLTLIVISAYAAAMLGKLTNLPMTYIGAMALGLAQSYVVGYLDRIPFIDPTKFTGLPAVIPTVFLFAILVLLPQAPLRIGQVKGIVTAPVPTLGRSAIWGAALIGVVVLLVAKFAGSDDTLVGIAAAFSIMCLSLVLLTGYGGFVSLAQVAFAGVGAVAYSKLDQPNLLGLFLSVLVAAAVGALVAIPVLRLTGLYLALATLAFAQLMDKLVFNADFAYKIGNPLYAERASVFGIEFTSIGSYAILIAVIFVLLALVVIAVRRGRIGRMLIAMRDSQAACGTLGLDLRWMRVGLFASSAGIAGLAGALLAGLRGTTVANDWIFFQSLILLLMAVVWGVTSVTGALIGGIFMMYLPVAQGNNPNVAGLLFMILGIGAIIVGRWEPNGLVNRMFMIPRLISEQLYPALAKRYPGMALRISGDADGGPEGGPVGADDPGLRYDDQNGDPLDETSQIPAVTSTEEVDDAVAAR